MCDIKICYGCTVGFIIFLHIDIAQSVRILYRYIQARAWQYKFHHLAYLREARFARQLIKKTFFWS